MGKATRYTTRKEIRKKIAEILKGKTDAENRVFPNRVIPVGVEELPAILIYPVNEDYTILRKDPNITHRRDLNLAIQILAQDSDEESLSDIIDDIDEQIEEVISNSDKLDELVHDINIDTGQAGFSGEGEKPEGSWTARYNVTYIKKPK